MPPGDPSSSPSPDEGSTSPVPATERVLSGFCHDLNGQLANASGFAHLLGPPADGEGPGRHLREALERMEALVRQLRWLARDDVRTPEPASLADLLQALVAVVPQHPRFRHAEIHIAGPADLPAVRIDFASALRVLLLAVDFGTGTEAVDTLTVRVEVHEDRVAVGPDGVDTGPPALEAALDREAREAGLARRGGGNGEPVRVDLPRLG